MVGKEGEREGGRRGGGGGGRREGLLHALFSLDSSNWSGDN